jgi:hypothetical protein
VSGGRGSLCELEERLVARGYDLAQLERDSPYAVLVADGCCDWCGVVVKGLFAGSRCCASCARWPA